MGHVNRVAVHQSVLHPAGPVACVLAARAGGVDSVGLHVASIDDAERAWGRGAGSPLLTAVVDALLVSRVTALDVGRVDLGAAERPDAGDRAGGGDPTDPAHPQHRALDLAARLGAQFVTARAGAADTAGATAGAFAALCEQARPFRVRPLLVPVAGTAVPTVRTALAVVDGTRGGVVLDVAPTDDPDEVADLVVEAGEALGYVRVPAGALTADMGAATSLLATLPPQVPVVIGTPGGGAEPGDRAAGPGTGSSGTGSSGTGASGTGSSGTGTGAGSGESGDAVSVARDGAFVAACCAAVDRLLVHPRAVEAERRRPVG